ncbi:PQQ-binding-like beta-propeller repeat protein [Natrarchaeobius sp. A-rgal3]|uniref:outer membrane protein assembly factor BamB family protein n=1 Tax=Natrarchaeobius versutus TaxID=1679078 RepID=UPI003510311B
MPSRRRLLAASATALAGSVGGAGVLAVGSGNPIPASPASATQASGSAERDLEWPMRRVDAAGTGYSPAASGPKDGVQRRWKRDPDASIRGTAAPILVGDALYVVGRRSLVALERETGHTRFVRDGPFFSAPAYVETSAYRTDALAVSGSAGIYGLDAAGGYDLPGRAVGLERWHAPGDPPSGYLSAEPREPSPVVADGTVYATLPETDRIAAFDANSGGLEWEYAIDGPSRSSANRPAVRDGTVFASNAGLTVSAVAADTGEERWAVEPDLVGPLSPTATNDGVVVPASNAVVALDADDGETLWTYDHGGNTTEGSAAVADGLAFVTDGDDELHAIDLETGEAEWTVEYGFATNPVVADGVVYVSYFWAGELVAFDLETGERRWTYDEPVAISQPAIGDGVIYVGVEDGVVALEEGS